MFIGQVWGTFLGPFVNYGMMRFIIDHIGKDTLTGVTKSVAWNALKTKNFYSLSVLWGVIGPKVLFSTDSIYSWIYYGFFVGPIAVLLTWGLHLWKPRWNIEYKFNPVMIFYGASFFPVYQTTNLFTSALLAFFL